jgi:hypothetical protein
MVTGDGVAVQLRSSGEGLFAGDARIVVEKLFQRLAAVEVVQKDPDRHACPDEHQSPAEDLGIGMREFLERHGLASIERRADGAKRFAAAGGG